MEHVHTRVHEGHQETFQLFRILRQLRFVILLLPLREAQHDREIFTNGFAYRLYDLDTDTGTVLDGTTVFVITLVGAFPEELVEQVTVGTVNLHAIKTYLFGGLRGLGKGTHHILDIFLGHGMAIFLAGLEQAGRGITGYILVRANTRLAYRTHMPQLRNNLATSSVHRIHDFLPARHGLVTINGRHPLVAVGGLVAHKGTFGDDQDHLTLGTALVIPHHLIVRHIARRKRTGHGRHGHPVTHLQGFVFKRTQQAIQGTTHGALLINLVYSLSRPGQIQARLEHSG